MQLVINYKKHASTTSRLVADKFGRLHKDVLQAIRKLKCSKDFTERNFTLSEYTDPTGRKLPEYIITKDGFVFLVMGFTGDLADKFKEEYIEQFNQMEAALREGEGPKNPLPIYTQRVLSQPTKSVPKGYWSVFDKAHAILLFIEINIGSVNKYDLADGSIGKMWFSFRTGKPWAVEFKMYTHEYDDNRGDRECKCYHNSELQYFDEWLLYTYKFDHLPKYLLNKYANERNIEMLEKVNTVLPKLLRAS